jgi:hypothetical protein
MFVMRKALVSACLSVLVCGITEHHSVAKNAWCWIERNHEVTWIIDRCESVTKDIRPPIHVVTDMACCIQTWFRYHLKGQIHHILHVVQGVVPDLVNLAYSTSHVEICVQSQIYVCFCTCSRAHNQSDVHAQYTHIMVVDAAPVPSRTRNECLPDTTWTRASNFLTHRY